MIFLLFATLTSSGFGLTVRYAQRENRNLITVGAVNYLAAALFYLTVSLITGWGQIHIQTVTIGAFGGVCFVTTFYFLFSFMKRRGVSITVTVVRLSVLVPIAVSLFVWGENTSTLQMVGGGLALFALPCLSIRRPSVRKRRTDRLAIILLFILFIFNGFSLLSIRWYHQTGITGEESVFLFFLFATAAVIGWIVWLFKREDKSYRESLKDSLKDLFPGILLGSCNISSNRLLLAALDRLPTMIVYPFFSAVGLTFTLLFSRIIWKEKITALETAGVVLTVLSLVLINLK